MMVQHTTHAHRRDVQMEVYGRAIPRIHTLIITPDGGIIKMFVKVPNSDKQLGG